MKNVFLQKSNDMKILFICPWPNPHSNATIDNLPNSNFGYFTLLGLGKDISWYSHSRESLLYRILRKLPQVNQLFTQIGYIRKEREFDVIYCGFDMHLFPLAILKMLGIAKKPVFVLSHFTYNTKYTNSKFKQIYKRLERYFVYRYIDKLSFASGELLDIAKKDYNIPLRHQNVANWGANLLFYNNKLGLNKANESFYIAVGGANRDYSTLISAFRNIKAELKIFARHKDYSKDQLLPPNVTFYNLFEGNSYIQAYEKLREYYYNAKAVLIPIDQLNDVPNGATVIVEALAMGKPIITTMSPVNYINIEEEKVGFVILRKDVHGWEKCINSLENDSQLLVDIGHNAIELAKNTYNDLAFSLRIYEQMKDLIDSRR